MPFRIQKKGLLFSLHPRSKEEKDLGIQYLNKVIIQCFRFHPTLQPLDVPTGLYQGASHTGCTSIQTGNTSMGQTALVFRADESFGQPTKYLTTSS